jgi:hypothetical protein
MHQRGLPFSLNVAATVAEAMGVEDAVDTVDTVEAVEPETATKVSAAIAKLTAILQMHAESGNALRREETTMSAFVSTAGSPSAKVQIDYRLRYAYRRTRAPHSKLPVDPCATRSI